MSTKQDKVNKIFEYTEDRTESKCMRDVYRVEGFLNTVEEPEHYTTHFPFEVISVINSILDTYGGNLTPSQSYHLGCELKYRLRAGFKDDAAEDIAKAMKYNEFRTKEK